MVAFLGPKRPVVAPVTAAMLLGLAMLLLASRRMLLPPSVAAPFAGALLRSAGSGDDEHAAMLLVPLPEPLLPLPLSSHNCTQEADPNHVVCAFSNLLMHRGNIYYLTDDPEVPVPVLDVKYQVRYERVAGVDKFAPTVLTRSNASFALDVRQWAAIPLAWLYSMTKKHPVLAHHYGEDMPNLHNALCTHLGECSYPPSGRVQVILLDPSWRGGGMLGGANDTVERCLTGRPAFHRDDAQLFEKAVLLETAWVGLGPVCRGQQGCSSDETYGKRRGDKRGPMPPAVLDEWRLRARACYGAPQDAPAPVRGKHILILDRPYEASRHMLNIRSVVQAVKARFPQDHVHLRYFEDLSFPEQMATATRTSLAIMMHGSALTFVPYMPRCAVVIHVSQDWETVNAQLIWAQWNTLDYPAAKLTYVAFNNTEPTRQQMRLERIVPEAPYQNLTTRQRLDLLENGVCPGHLTHVCRLYWKRMQISLVVNLTGLASALDQAEEELLRKAASADCR